ncbi:hypothetical protein Tco_0519842 [Tanacetum coccineum]
MGITTTIDRKVKITVSEASIRRHLKLEDTEGIPSLLTLEIFEQLALMGTFNFSKFIFDAMGEEPSIQTTPETSPSKITSLPSLSSHHTSISASSTSQPPITSTEEPDLMPYESPIHSVHSLGRDEGSMQQHEFDGFVKNLEKTVKTSKARRRVRVVLLEDEDAAEDSSKQGRKIFDIDTDPTISLVQPQQDIEYDFNVSIAKGFTTASIPITTASASISIVSPPRVSTVEDISGAETLVYIRISASKAKDKGKAIMKEFKPPNKIKKMVQVKMSIDEELAKKVFEEEQARFNTEQEARFKVEQEQERIDFETALELQKKKKGSEKKTGGRRKKLLARKRAKETLSEQSAKKQKLEDDAEKEELQVYLNIVLEEESLDVESLATKYPIIDWETQILANDKCYYQIKRADGSVKHYKIFSAMLYDFDRQDVLELYRLVKDRF